MDYSHMAPGGLIPQLGGGAAVIPDDLDFGTQPGAYPYPPAEELEGDVPSYMKDVERETDPDAIKSPGEEHESEPEEEIRIGMIKRCKDGSEWLITHFCDVCKVGLCSERQLEAHNAGKPHEKKLRAMNDNTLAYTEFLRKKESGDRNYASPWKCEVCDTTLNDADQYQIHIKGKPHEKKLRVRAGNTKVFDYFCDLCGINTGNNRMVYDAHIDGQKHQKRLYNGKIDLAIADPAESAYYCEICKIHMDCASQFISHLGGQQHLRRMKGQAEPPEVLGNSGLLQSTEGKANTYWCDVCKISMSGHQPFEAHMAGAKHKARVAALSGGGPQQQQQQQKQQQQQRGQKRGFSKAPGDIPYISGDSGPQAIPQHPLPQQPKPPKLPSQREVVIDKKCDICNIQLKTQSSYDAHMNGQAHLKKKKMLDSLGGRVVMPEGSLARKILDDGPMVKEGVLFCQLCDMKLLTLQMALDHFPARRHRTKMRTSQAAHESTNGGAAGWISGVSKLAGVAEAGGDAAATPGGYNNFVAGGTISTIGTIPTDVVMDKADIDAKIKEARVASGVASADDVDDDAVDAHVKAFQEAKMDGAGPTTEGGADGSSKEGTPAGGDAAEAMDMLVKEVSPHDTTAIVCHICNIGVTTTQMLENHVVGSKHIRKVITLAVADGKDIAGLKGKGIPGKGPPQRGRGRGRGGFGGGRGFGGRGRGGRGGGFQRGGGGGAGGGGGGGGIGGGASGRPVVSASQVMRTDNDGSTFDYMAVKHKPPVGYDSKTAQRANDVTPGWASWNDTRYQPGSGGWTPWTG